MPVAVGPSTLTINHDRQFLVSQPNATMAPQDDVGFYAHDTRFVSGYGLTLTRVVLPLSAPALTSLAIFSFQGQWNDFLWPLVILNDPQLFTLPLGIAGFGGEYVQNTNWVLVASIFTTIPMVRLVFFFQRYIIKSVATTGGK